MLRSILAWVNNAWPWNTPLDRRKSVEYWGRKAEVIRTNRITQPQAHRRGRDMGAIVSHSQDPYHCVCNGTHVSGFFCPRCPQAYIINDIVEWK